MKKHLLLFPLLAGLVLSGCEFEIFGTKISLFEKEEEKKQENKQEEQKEGEEQGEEEDAEFKITNQPVLKETFGNYKLAKSVQEGKRYIIAAYKHDHDKMLVFNGDYHRDTVKGEEKFYPFYLGGEFDSTENAAEVEIHMVSDTGFTIQVHAEGKVWDGKYIGVYSAISGYSNKVMSIAILDSPTQESYVDPSAPEKGETDKPSAIFKFHGEEYGGQIFAPAADYLYKDVDEEAVPKFIGTSGDYKSIDCKSYEVALDGESYDLAHFYELAE